MTPIQIYASGIVTGLLANLLAVFTYFAFRRER